MKLIKVKQIIAEVVKNSHISSEIKKLVTEDNNLQQSIEEYVNNTETSQEEVEEALNEFPVEDIVNPYEQAIDEMIAEEMEEAKKTFIVNEEEDQCTRLAKIIKDLWPYRGEHSNQGAALMKTEQEYKDLGCQKQESIGEKVKHTNENN